MVGKNIIVIGVGIGVLYFLFTGKASDTSSLIVSDILSVDTLYKLDTYYEYMNELYIEDKLTDNEYTELYNAYTRRYHELSQLL